jgi:hypothetical protein
MACFDTNLICADLPNWFLGVWITLGSANPDLRAYGRDLRGSTSYNEVPRALPCCDFRTEDDDTIFPS